VSELENTIKTKEKRNISEVTNKQQLSALRNECFMEWQANKKPIVRRKDFNKCKSISN
jgi:hypothetical protein